MTDITKLTNFAMVVKSGTPLKLVLNEVLAIVPMVVSWSVIPTSGSAVCRYDTATGRPSSYEIKYQTGNIGNLVHELIHAAVNESYGQDFINFSNPTAAPPSRTYDGFGRCTNEDARQLAYFRGSDTAQNKISGTLQELMGWANAASELSAAQRTAIDAKLRYGLQSPHKEYDTVITQVLVWLVEWGYPIRGASKKPIVNALYEEVEKAVATTYRQRREAKIFLRNKEMLAQAMQQRRVAMGYKVGK